MKIEDLEIAPQGGDVEAATRVGGPDEYLERLHMEAHSGQLLIAYGLVGLSGMLVGFAMGCVFMWVVL